MRVEATELINRQEAIDGLIDWVRRVDNTNFEYEEVINKTDAIGLKIGSKI